MAIDTEFAFEVGDCVKQQTGDGSIQHWVVAERLYSVDILEGRRDIGRPERQRKTYRCITPTDDSRRFLSEESLQVAYTEVDRAEVEAEYGIRIRPGNGALE